MVRYTNEDKLNMILIYGECRRNSRKANRLFRLRFPNRPTPDKKTFIMLCKNLRNYGSFKKTVRTRRRSVRNDENTALVLNNIINNPQCSLRQLASQTNLSVSSCHRILKTNKYYPYKIHLVHSLRPSDYERRLHFLAEFSGLSEELPNF